jgi:hypothetical protein
MTTIISLLLLSTAAVAYCISQLQIQGKLKWSNDNHYVKSFFWSQESWSRKYEVLEDQSIVKAPNTYYYKLFNLKYKERFPGSATVFVALTDGYHLCQAIFLLCVSASIAIHYDRWFISLIIIRAVFGIVFSIAYKVLAK